MRWNMLGTFVLLLSVICWCDSIETQDHAPAFDKTYHFPSASLTIAGDLKDVKLKGTIAQLVRALQPTPKPIPLEKAEPESEPKPKATDTSGTKKIIHPSQLITKHTLQKDGKKLYYGDPVPGSITVSSQSVSVKVSDRNTTGNKKARHLAAYIGNRPSAVRVVEGTRVPDAEEDQYYTWRNARVIKGFLVPKGRPANPHKKRQVIITDPQQYLMAAAAAQAQGAATIFEAGTMPQSQSSNNGQPRTSIFYAQEQQQSSHHQQQQGGNSGGSVFANDPTQQRSHPHVAYPNQQNHQTANNNGQTSAYVYSQQNPHSMYVLQDSANNAYGNNQYNGNPGSAAAPSTAHISNQNHHQQAQVAQQPSQAQFFARSGEAPTVSSVALASSQNSQQQNRNQNQNQQQQQQQQSLSATIKQQYQPSLDTQAIQAAVEAVQQLEAQQAAAAAASQQSSQAQELQAQRLQALQQQQAQHLLAQQSAQSQTVVLPGPGTAQLLSAGGATAQEILAATAAATNGQVTAQYIQIQPSQEQSILQLPISSQQQQQQQYPAANQFAERQTFTSASNPQFVIQSQTYSGGPGGQTFTVPIPVPVEQAIASQQQNHQQNHQAYHQQQGSRQHNSGDSQQFNHHHQYQHQQQSGNNPNSNNRQVQPGQNNQNGHNNHNQNQQSITDRMKHAFNQNFNRKMLERVETNAVVPALASTGLFLGLSALAAGWYLSKNNREVGIVRRTSHFSKKSGSPSSSPSAATPEKDKEASANSRSRRDLASMVTPQAYTPGGAPEVDQATFFQSIIQQSLEKTQKEYEDVPEQVYQQTQDSNNDGPMGYHRGDVDPPSRHAPQAPPPPPPPSRYRSNKYSKYNDKPRDRYRDDDYYESPANPRISKSQQIQEKSGWSVHSAKNFARVAIPAVVLTGAALGICAVIFGWYISGDNREIAFLESPATQTIGGHSAYNRKKRSLFGSSTTAWSDGWLIRTLKAIHGNPYDNMPAPTAKSFVPYPYFLDKDSSKTSSLEFKVSNNGLAGVLAGGAVLAVVALGLINSFSESSGRNIKTARYNQLLTHSGAAAAFANNNGKSLSSTNPLTHLRSPRNMASFENNLEYQHLSSPSFFESIVSSLEASGDTIMTKLHELGTSSNWHQSSCTKRVLCQVIATQGDDTLRLMEKKMASVMKMLPDSVSSSINKNYSDVLSAIYKRDCSAFTCATQKQKPTQIIKSKSLKSSSVSSSSLPQAHHNEHEQKSSIKIEQTVTNHQR